MSQICKWLHEQLKPLKCIQPQRYGFRIQWEKIKLPPNGIYFFYEDDEVWGHGENEPRIVTIGSHDKPDRFLKRIQMHYHNAYGSSRLRKHIGRALLNKRGCWQESDSHIKTVESQITKLLQQHFCFRFIIVDSENEREALEKALIGSVAQCAVCKPTDKWLGNYSPDKLIRKYGLWQNKKEELKHRPLNDGEMKTIYRAVKRTQQWVKSDC